MYNLDSGDTARQFADTVTLKMKLYSKFREEIAADAEAEKKRIAERREKLKEINVIINEYADFIDSDIKLVEIANSYKSYLRLPPKYQALKDAHAMDLGWEFRHHYAQMDNLVKKDSDTALKQLKDEFYPDRELESWIKTRTGFKKQFEKYAAGCAEKQKKFRETLEKIALWSPEDTALLLEKAESELKKHLNVMRKRGFLDKLDHYGTTVFQKLEKEVRGFLKSQAPGEYNAYYVKSVKSVYTHYAMTMDVYVNEKMTSRTESVGPLNERIDFIHKRILLEQLVYLINKNSGRL